MVLLPTNPSYNLAITITLYDRQGKTTSRSFHLRNMSSKTEAAQIEEARQLLDAVAGEIHYLTGFGVDKGSIKRDGKKVQEVAYKELALHSAATHFRHAALFRFPYARCYQWVKNGKQRWRINAEELDEGWHVETVQRFNKTISFTLPCVALSNPHYWQLEESECCFFRYHDLLKKGRRIVGIDLSYDWHDPVLNRFQARFYDEGQLAVSEKRYFGSSTSFNTVVGRFWPQPEGKPPKVPRPSRLASRPTDATDYVYIIRMGRTKLYKIGKSNDPQSRLNSLQTASPYPLQLLHVFKADNASAAEEKLHHALHAHRREGEWFQLTDEQRVVLVVVIEYKEGKFILPEKAVDVKVLLNTG